MGVPKDFRPIRQGNGGKQAVRSTGRMGWAVLFILAVVFVCLPVMAQFTWESPVWISPGDNPDIDIDRRNGHLHVICMRNGVLYTELDGAGNILLQEPVPGAEGDAGEWQFGATIAVDSEGYPHVCYRDWEETGNPDDRFYDIYYTRKRESGWAGTPLQVANHVWRGYAVRMAIDGLDRVHIVHGSALEDEIIGGPASYYRITGGFIELRRDDLVSYRADDRLEIDASGSGNVHIILGSPDPNGGPVSYYRSQDGGGTLFFMGDIHSPSSWGRNGCPDVFVDTTGAVHFSYGAQHDGMVNNKPAVRYVRYSGNTQARNVVVSPEDALTPWKDGDGWGLSSVAASDDGKYVVVAYLSRDGGSLYARVSEDWGGSWSQPALLDHNVGGDDGRNLPVVRAFRNHFYLAYPSLVGIRLRILRNVGDQPPVAHTGGPYSGQEGNPLTLDMSASSDAGEYAGIIQYAWDWDGDGTLDDSTDSPQITKTFQDDFQASSILRVTDRAGFTDWDTTQITISNVPPWVGAGDDMTCDEGDTLTFSAEIIDPGVLDSHTIIWYMGSEEILEGETAQVVFPDDSVYRIRARAEDDDGGIGWDSLEVTVLNVAPVAEAGGPYSGTAFEEVEFSGQGYDPGVRDSLTYSWDLDGDRVFERHGQTVTGSYNQLGTFRIRLRVEDQDGGAGVDSALVHITNEAPVLAAIPDQAVFEGEPFSTLFLDDYVEDPDQPDDQLDWTVEGYTELQVGLANRILTVAVPDSEWYGSETVFLTVKDPMKLQDTTSVMFTVYPVNDPPFLGDIPDYILPEDDTLHIPLAQIWDLVTDVDDDSGTHSLSLEGGVITGARVEEDEVFRLVPMSHWYGVQQVVFVLADTAGAQARDTSVITVTSVPDPPGPFLLSEPLNATYPEWPDSIRFEWYSSTDPDPDDIVYYVWTLSGQGGVSGSATRTVTIYGDTTCLFYPDTLLPEGIYFWWVEARDPSDSTRESQNNGILMVGDTPVMTEEEAVPEEFFLFPNYPNPFNPHTTLAYQLPVTAEVRLAVFDPLGRQVRVLVSGVRSAGSYTVEWDGKDGYGRALSSGVYVARLKAGGKIFYQKMLLIQ
jgi:hypothetical protein